MPGKFFTSEGAFSNTDIDNIFEPLGSFTKGPDVGYLDGGLDISNLYAPASAGSTAANTGYLSGGVDLGQLFAAIGTAASDAQITGPSEINEGVTQQYTFSGNNLPLQTYFWRIEHVDTDAADFSGATSGFFNYVGVDVDFSISTVADGSTEGSEAFNLQVSSDAGFDPGDIVVERIITILDTSTTPATFTFIAPIPADVDEGSSASFTIQGENTPAQTLWWTIETVQNTNLGQFSPSSGPFNITSPNAFDGFNGTFNVGAVADQLTAAGVQLFRVQVRTGGLGGPIVATSPNVTLNDTSQTPVVDPTYTVDAFTPGLYVLDEGQAVPISVVVANGPANTTPTYFFRILHISTNDTDFLLDEGVIPLNPGSFTIEIDGSGDGSRALIVWTALDFTQAGVNEGNETYQVEIRTAPFPGGTVLATSPTFTQTNINSEIFEPFRTVGGTTFQAGLASGVAIEHIVGAFYRDGAVPVGWDIIGTGASPAVPSDFVASAGTFVYDGVENVGVSRFAVTPVVKPSGSPAKTFRIRIRATTAAGTIIGESVELTIPAQIAPDSFQIICGHAAYGGIASFGTITSSISFNPNGTVTTGGSNPLTSSVSVVDWKTPTQTGVGNDYQIRAEFVSGVSGIPSTLWTSGAGAGAWSALNIARTWSNSVSSVGIKGSIIRYTIRRTSDSTIVAGPANIYLVSANQTAFPELGGHCALVPSTPPPPPPPPPGGGGGGSVSVYAYMPNTEKRAGDMVAGDGLTLLSLDRDGTMPGAVISNRSSMQNLVTLVSESGIRLTCSDNTPLTLRDGSSINSTEALGQYLPVQDQNGFRWEKIVDVLNAGNGYVATIYCADQCYAAGDEPGRWIWTHNMSLVKN